MSVDLLTCSGAPGIHPEPPLPVPAPIPSAVDPHTVERSACAVAMAGLGTLPDTILTRSVIIRMRMKAPNEKCEPYRRRVHEKQGHALRDRLADWTATLHDQVAEMESPTRSGS